MRCRRIPETLRRSPQERDPPASSANIAFGSIPTRNSSACTSKFAGVSSSSSSAASYEYTEMAKGTMNRTAVCWLHIATPDTNAARLT